MTPSHPGPTPSVRMDPNVLPPPKWWGQYVLEGTPPQRRFVLRWKRLLSVFSAFLVTAYLVLATALWGYYAIDRKIPGVHWIDVAVLPRFPRVQAAIGAKYFADAQEAWKQKDYVRSIYTARAAVQKSPGNLDARLFLADCWRLVGRNQEAVRTLRDGIKFTATDPRLQQAVIETSQQTGRYQDTLALLREDFPAQGVRLLDRDHLNYEMAEVNAVFQTEGAASASALAAGYPELSLLPQAAPLLAGIEEEQGRGAAALERLRIARDRTPSDAGILFAYANVAKKIGRADEARAAAKRFLQEYPRSLDAQLCFLEMFGSRKGEDREPWMGECLQFLGMHRHEPDAMGRLASLSASEGWSDIAFLLYENSLQENLTGMPFVIYYAASLVKAGDVGAAESIWRQLALRNGPQIASAAYIEAMLAWSAGRESEAMQIVDQLRHDTTDDPARRRTLETLFRTFGYPKIADDLMAKRA